MGRPFSYPPDGALMQYYREGDFLDTQCVPLPHPVPDADELTLAIFFSMPGWARALLTLRNRLVAPLGLKTGEASALRAPTRQEISTATYTGLFAVHSATPDEVVLGTDDRHLDFRVSILKSEATDRVALTTWAHPHNLGGRIYLSAVYPLHRLMVARCLANARLLGVTREP